MFRTRLHICIPSGTDPGCCVFLNPELPVRCERDGAGGEEGGMKNGMRQEPLRGGMRMGLLLQGS